MPDTTEPARVRYSRRWRRPPPGFPDPQGIVLAILNVTIPFFALVLCGYLAARSRRLPLAAVAPLNSFVLYFALPSLLFRFVANSPFRQIANTPIFIAYGVAGLLVFALTARSCADSITSAGATPPSAPWRPVGPTGATWASR